MSLEGKRGLEEGRSLYTYVTDVFYLLYICFGMEEERERALLGTMSVTREPERERERERDRERELY